jgi:hypothetical protein
MIDRLGFAGVSYPLDLFCQGCARSVPLSLYPLPRVNPEKYRLTRFNPGVTP